MSCLKDVPTLKVDMAFICAEVDWVLGEPQPVKPPGPVTEADDDDDDAWAKKQRDYAPVEMSYSLSNQKWINANKSVWHL